MSNSPDRARRLRNSRYGGKDRDVRQPNEGEGNYTAAREFVRQEREFVKSGQVEPAAKEAERAQQTSEKNELEKAETIGRRPARS